MRLHTLSICLSIFCVTTTAFATVLQVEGPQDSLAGAPTINHCTLRKAIINSNNDAATYPQCAAGSGVDTIEFLSPMTVTFALAGISDDAGLTGDLDITQSVIINGGGSTIDAALLDRIFDINPGGAPGVTVTLNDLYIRNGSGLGGGGGIRSNNATVYLNHVTISGSHAPEGDGGGILMTNGGALTLTNCTISGNDAAFHAGAMVLEGLTNIVNSTISANASLTGLTGGLRALGTVTLRNSIVAGNTNISPLDYIPNLDGTFTSAGYNVIGDLGAAPGNPLMTATTGDQFSVTTAAVNLGPLQVNGSGPPTHALLSPSVAIDKGHSSGSSTDERGLVRPCDLASVANATGGDGADVGAFEVQGTCAGTNTDPVATADTVTVAEDSGANIVDVLANDSDADGDTLTITAATQGSHGIVATSASSVTYAPAPDYFGTDAFSYTISDGNGGTATATVSVTVTNVNDTPVATADSYTTNQDTLLSVASPGVLGNDSDIDGDSLNAVLVASPGHGALTLNGNGSFSYMPAPHFAGNDSFTYRANDGQASSASVIATIHVNDTEPPDPHASVSVASLWPPNHDLVNVGFVFAPADNSGLATTNLAVFSNEDDLPPGSADHSPDAKNIGSGTLRLRAERSGNSARVYLIRATATDNSGNTGRTCLTVVVANSSSAKDIGAANAAAEAARQLCVATGNSPTGYFVVGDAPPAGPKQ